MPKVKSFLLIMIAMVALIVFPLIGRTTVNDTGRTDGRHLPAPDTIIIDLDAETAGNDMPPVSFSHALHSRAADGQCAACHIQTEDTVAFSFKGAQKTGSMALYHDNCIACHVEKNGQGEKSGPLTAECRSCHGAETKTAETGWHSLRFDKSLHAVHEQSKAIKPLSESHTDNCSACHHKYNIKTKQTYYIQGEEESCTYCHKDRTVDDIRALRQAAHDSCVACHLKMAAGDVAAGPVTCAGCHDVNEQAKIKTRDDIPRMKRNQPDVVFLAGLFSDTGTPEYRMKPVGFDHKSHETRTESCTACHHGSMKKCSECHTPKGDAGGNFIQLEQAMHAKRSEKSCIGCHTAQTRSKDCAGCHTLMPEKPLADNNCASCHNIENTDVITDPELQKHTAGQAVNSRSGSAYQRVATEQIPETVVIKDLTDEYQPSEFPHRKVVQAIAGRVESNALARTFHQNELTLCAGCHHNSPVSAEPPKCASCHGRSTDLVSGKPHLKGAYHGQCISCHQKMEIKEVAATDCIKCHAKK